MLLSIILSFAFQSQAFDASQYYFDSQGNSTTIESVLSKVRAGDVVVIGERHGFEPHHFVQRDVIHRLQSRGLEVSLGIEHISYDKQDKLNDYLANKTTEERFLKEIGWGPSGGFTSCYDYTDRDGHLDPFSSQPFDCYRPQIESVYGLGGQVLGINLSRKLTSKVSRNGLGSLTPEEAKWLPPNFQLGNDLYYERFKEVIMGGGGHHGNIDEDMVKRMFLAQSLWDETMAWQSLNYLDTEPDKVFVIVVGDFHASYGGGLPHRLLERGASNVWTISQDVVVNESLDSMIKLAAPSPLYGERAHLTVVTDFVPQ